MSHLPVPSDGHACCTSLKRYVEKAEQEMGAALNSSRKFASQAAAYATALDEFKVRVACRGVPRASWWSPERGHRRWVGRCPLRTCVGLPSTRPRSCPLPPAMCVQARWSWLTRWRSPVRARGRAGNAMSARCSHPVCVPGTAFNAWHDLAAFQSQEVTKFLSSTFETGVARVRRRQRPFGCRHAL